SATCCGEEYAFGFQLFKKGIKLLREFVIRREQCPIHIRDDQSYRCKVHFLSLMFNKRPQGKTNAWNACGDFFNYVKSDPDAGTIPKSIYINYIVRACLMLRNRLYSR